MQRTVQAELFAQAPRGRSMVSARRGWLQQLFDQYRARAALTPALLQQQLAGAIEDQQRKGPVQVPRP